MFTLLNSQITLLIKVSVFVNRIISINKWITEPFFLVRYIVRDTVNKLAHGGYNVFFTSPCTVLLVKHDN